MAGYGGYTHPNGMGRPRRRPTGRSGLYGPGTGVGLGANLTPQSFTGQPQTGQGYGGIGVGWQTPEAVPVDPMVEAMKASGARQVGLADARALYDTGRITSDYGYDASGGIDPNNPYSRAALLQKSFQNSQRGNTNSYAGQGQLYSGALQNAQNESTRQYNIADDANRKGFRDAIDQVKFNQLGTYSSVIGGVDQAAYEALLAYFKPKG